VRRTFCCRRPTNLDEPRMEEKDMKEVMQESMKKSRRSTMRRGRLMVKTWSE
jgi:hypothetical protein